MSLLQYFKKRKKHAETILDPSSMAQHPIELFSLLDHNLMDSLNPTTYAGLALLVVDDSAEQLDVIHDFLTQYGADVDIALTGERALQFYLEAPEKYDIILIDLHLPSMSGEDTAQQIRSSNCPGAKNLPIVAVTGNFSKYNYNETVFTYTLQKPFSMNQLAHFLSSIRSL